MQEMDSIGKTIEGAFMKRLVMLEDELIGDSVPANSAEDCKGL